MSISESGLARDNQTSKSYWTAPGRTNYATDSATQTSMATTSSGNVKITFQRTETVTFEGSADQIADMLPGGFNFGQAYSSAQEGGASPFTRATPPPPPPQTARDYPTNRNQPTQARAMIGSGGRSDNGGNNPTSEALVTTLPKYYGQAGGLVDIQIA